MKLNEHLKVHLIFSDDYIKKNERHKLEQIKEIFGDRFTYLVTPRVILPLAFATVENHVKLTIVDGKYAIVGGTGITDNLSTVGEETPAKEDREITFDFAELIAPSAARDQDVILKGPLAMTAREQFFNLFQKWEAPVSERYPMIRFFKIDEKGTVATVDVIDMNPRLDANVHVKLFACGPESEKNPCTKAIEQLIVYSEDQLVVAHMFQNYVRGIYNAMNHVLKKGTSVDIVTTKYDLPLPESIGGGKSGLQNILFCSSFDEVIGENLTRYQYDVERTLYHKKIILSKGLEEVCFAIGSYNLGKKSDSTDDEIMVIVCQALGKYGAAVQGIIDALNKDKSLSTIDKSVKKIDKIEKVLLTDPAYIKHLNAGGPLAFLIRTFNNLANNLREIIGGFGV